MSVKAPDDASPWSVPVRLADLKRQPEVIHLDADAATRARIAQALDLVALERLEAEVRLTPWFDGAEIVGRWRAGVVQTCGVSLEPFAAVLESEMHVRCIPPDSRMAAAAETSRHDEEIVIDPDAEDPPDVLEGSIIDLGAYVVEHLALQLDPFPRKPGVEFDPPPVEAPASPFAVLAKLKPPGDDR